MKPTVFSENAVSVVTRLSTVTTPSGAVMTAMAGAPTALPGRMLTCTVPSSMAKAATGAA